MMSEKAVRMFLNLTDGAFLGLAWTIFVGFGCQLFIWGKGLAAENRANSANASRATKWKARSEAAFHSLILGWFTPGIHGFVTVVDSETIAKDFSMGFVFCFAIMLFGIEKS